MALALKYPICLLVFKEIGANHNSFMVNFIKVAPTKFGNYRMIGSVTLSVCLSVCLCGCMSVSLFSDMKRPREVVLGTKVGYMCETRPIDFRVSQSIFKVKGHAKINFTHKQ